MELKQLKKNQNFIITAYEMADSSGALDITQQEYKSNSDIVKLLQQKLNRFCEENAETIIKEMENRKND